jgi:serine/threonine protein kinase
MERRVRRRLEYEGEGRAGALAAAVDALEIPSARLVLAEELGRGSFGRVRAATAWPLGDVAVKEPWDGASEAEVCKFREEAASQSRVKHANVLRILAVISEEAVPGRPGGRFGIVMPRMETTLGLAIQHARLNGELCEMAAFQGAQGLAAIHAQGVLHRDIKSSNALVTFSARGLLLCWADFRLAHAADGTLRTVNSSRAMGTWAYMAPELWHVARPAYSKATDVYAFGLVAAEIVSGRPPVRGVEGEREQRVLTDEMRAGSFDVRHWAAEDLRENVARCMLSVADQCTRNEACARPDMSSVVAALFARDPDALPAASLPAAAQGPAREARECTVCFDRLVTTVLRPCSHACLCVECAELVVEEKICPSAVPR